MACISIFPLPHKVPSWCILLMAHNTGDLLVKLLHHLACDCYALTTSLGVRPCNATSVWSGSGGLGLGDAYRSYTDST